MARKPHLLIHLHIAKNGGTTLGRMLRVRSALWPPNRWRSPLAAAGLPQFPNGRAKIAAIATMSPAKRRRVRLFEAHMGFGVHDRLGVAVEDCQYITVLRHPVDRAVSAYEEVMATPDAPRLSLSDFLDYDGTPRWPKNHYPFSPNNGQVRYLAGEHGDLLDLPPEEVGVSHLQKAIERLDHYFTTVLVLERFDASMMLLGRRLGMPGFYSLRSNVRTKSAKPRRETIEQQLFERIKSRNVLDLQLYEYACNRLDRDLAKAFSDPERALTHRRRWQHAAESVLTPVWSLLPAIGRLARR